MESRADSLQVKRVLGRRDNRHIANKPTNPAAAAAANGKAATAGKGSRKGKESDEVNLVQQEPTGMWFNENLNLQPPYRVLLDTNFFSHTVRNKVDVLEGLMDALLAKCIPVVTDCVMAELEKLGPKYRLPLRLARDERWERLTCSHTGNYADDCIVDVVTKDRIYLVGTNDADLRRRLRKVKGVPLIAVGRGKYSVERLPSAYI